MSNYWFFNMLIFYFNDSYQLKINQNPPPHP